MVNILALEASTSSAKAMVYSSKRGVLALESLPFEKEYSDVVTQDADKVYNRLLLCGKRAVEKAGKDIDVISLCTTWHSFLLVDKDGKPIEKIKTWANTEASSVAREYRKKGFASWFYRRTGCILNGTYPVWKYIYSLRTGEAGENTYISSQAEYIFEKLTGQRKISISTAAGTGFLNIHTLNWDEEILQMAKVHKYQLSELCSEDTTAPLREEAAAFLRVKKGIPVVVPGPDGAFNQIGAGALKKGIMTMSVGTSGAIRMVADKPVLPSTPSTWCYYVAEGKRLAGAATAGAGNCVEWFVNKVGRGNFSYSELEKMAAVAEREKAPVFLPFLYGERSPGWSETRRGFFCGLRGDHGIGEMYYALLEGVLFNLYHCYRILLDVMGEPDEIRISGGIENSELWLQMAADIFQKEIHTSGVKHASIMGAIALALKVLGEFSSLEEFEPGTGEKITPDASVKNLYAQRFNTYLKWYEETSKEG